MNTSKTFLDLTKDDIGTLFEGDTKIKQIIKIFQKYFTADEIWTCQSMNLKSYVLSYLPFRDYTPKGNVNTGKIFIKDGYVYVINKGFVRTSWGDKIIYKKDKVIITDTHWDNIIYCVDTEPSNLIFEDVKEDFFVEFGFTNLAIQKLTWLQKKLRNWDGVEDSWKTHIKSLEYIESEQIRKLNKEIENKEEKINNLENTIKELKKQIKEKEDYCKNIIKINKKNSKIMDMVKKIQSIMDEIENSKNEND